MLKPAPVKLLLFYFRLFNDKRTSATWRARARTCTHSRTRTANPKELHRAKSRYVEPQCRCYGRRKHETQINDLRRGAAVVIATPGRLLDLKERGAINLSTVEFLVLDEADRMLDMGFLPAIRRVLARLPAKSQTLLFSATMSSTVESLARSTMTQPKLVEVSPRGRAAQMIEQTAYSVAQENKTALLLDLLERGTIKSPWKVLVFTRTRRGSERLSHVLRARNHSVNRIHADRSQPQREAALRNSAMVVREFWWLPTLRRADLTLMMFLTSLFTTYRCRKIT